MVASGHGATLFYLMTIVAASIFFYSLQDKMLIDELKQTEPLELFEWEELVIAGEIVESGKSSSGRPVYIVEIDETKITENVTWREDYKIRLYADTSVDINLSNGNKIEANILLYEFPERRNPHEFDYGGWLQSQGISAHGAIQEVIVVEKGWWFQFGWFRHKVLESIDKTFDKDGASLAKALLLGYKDDLTPEDKKQFSRAGLSHIMAVSGLHVGFIVAPFWFLIPYLWNFKKGKWVGMILLTTLLFCYAGLTGFSASVSRASLMAWFLSYGRMFHKVRNSINLTAVAAIILLLLHPNDLFDPGFQLSFSAVFIILLVMPEVKRLIPRKYHFGWKGGLIMIILVSIVVQLGLFPILSYYFGEFSVVGPLSNALVIPVLTFAVPVGLIMVLFSPFLPEIVFYPIAWMLRWIESVAMFTGGNQFSFIKVNDFSWVLFLIWLFAILGIASIQIPKIRWKVIISFLLVLNIYLLEQVIYETKPKTLEVTFLDVGQGDAIYIQTPNNKHVLIDAGRWTPGTNSGKEVIIPYLKSLGVSKLDAMILSHPHADHIGGASEIILEFPVDTIYQSDVNYNSELYETFMELADEKKIPVIYPKAGDILSIDPSIRMFVLGPVRNLFNSNPNNRSLVIKLVYGDTSILFSGDAEREQEEILVSMYKDFLDSDLYKVAHHASNTSSTIEFLNYVEPDISVASLGLRNKFRHPGSETVSRLHSFSEIQAYTSLSGAVVYESDGQSFRKVNWKK